MEKIQFGKFFKTLFGNGEEYVKDDDLEKQVNDIIAQEENKDWRNKLENSVASTGNKAEGKKSDRINVKASKKEMAKKSVENRERDEER